MPTKKLGKRIDTAYIRATYPDDPVLGAFADAIDTWNPIIEAVSGLAQPGPDWGVRDATIEKRYLPYSLGAAIEMTITVEVLIK